MLPDWLVLELTQFQLYGLIFILGSFTVATLSDLKYMKAQGEFVEIWVLCLVVFIAIDLWKFSELDKVQFAAKWILIIVFMAIANRHTGVLFKLAMGDVVACAAVMALLTPPLIVIFIFVLKISSFFLKPILKGFGSGKAYPFMPVVMVAAIAVLIIGFKLAG